MKFIDNIIFLSKIKVIFVNIFKLYYLDIYDEANYARASFNKTKIQLPN
jgi:hypothetical protein